MGEDFERHRDTHTRVFDLESYRAIDEISRSMLYARSTQLRSTLPTDNGKRYVVHVVELYIYLQQSFTVCEFEILFMSTPVIH